MGDRKADSKKVLIEMIQRITEVKTVYSYGDQCLYKMSENVIGDPDDKKIASMIWLIGRSYAASPERINGMKDSDEKPEVFFDRLARRIKEKVFDDNNDFFDRELTYEFDGKENDLNVLTNTVRMVKTLNDIRRDFGGNNMISFASKFLHFCNPKRVFIIDQFSQNGSKRLFEAIRNNTAEKIIENDFTIKDLRDVLRSCEAENLITYKKVLETVAKNIKDDKWESDEQIDPYKIIDPYKKHVCACYSLAMCLRKCNRKTTGIKINGCCSMPRLIDSFLIEVGSK